MAKAPDTTLSKQLEDLLRCSTCTELSTEPRTLGCFHSFCKKCLAKHVKSQRKEAGKDHEHPFNCPLCRTQFPRGSVEQLQPNFFINNLLEMLRLLERASHLACESCTGNVSAICRCVECERYLCNNCLTAHKNYQALKGHVVLTMEELAKPENYAKVKAKARCHKDGHGNKLLEFYCNTCQELACMTCVVSDHSKQEHDCQPVDVVAKQHKEELKKTANILQMKYDKSQNALQQIKCASENLQANTKKAKDDILQHEKEILEEFTEELKRQTASLIVKVETKHDKVNQKIVEQHDEMKTHVEMVKGSLEFAKNIIEKGSNEEILSFGNKIKENANSIEKICPKVLRPVHPGDIKYQQKKSSKNVLDNYVDLNNLGEIIVEPRVEIQSLLVHSNILDDNINLAEQLADWVENKEFGWKLCYRASRDGWRAIDFHRMCDDVGPTVTLIKCGTNVFGGYTDASWKVSNPSRIIYCRKLSKQSFLFSLRNKDNLPPFKCPIYDKKLYGAIVCASFHGPSFGNHDDLYISDQANTNQDSSSNLGDTYQPPPRYRYGTPQTQALLAGSHKFTPTEIEVFAVK